MALVWNTYNIILMVAIVIFAIGILLLSYKLVAAPQKVTDFEKMLGLDEIMQIGQEEGIGQRLSATQSATQSAIAKQSTTGAEVEVGGSKVPPTESVTKAGKSVKGSSSKKRRL